MVMKEASAMTEASGLTNEQDGSEHTFDPRLLERARKKTMRLWAEHAGARPRYQAETLVYARAVFGPVRDVDNVCHYAADGG